ncbi:MAG TPA: enoyl-CoA hydratase-related protein [Oligoflexia bacterium]|nr:enoyl-CoA hydratase-related protein [Oligoflexia bacterium]HMR24991.1 enoyl-CoA hydratase-related protein [Oligoflexia bacterium]
MSVILKEQNQGQVTLTFNRPEALNALNQEVLETLLEHLRTIAQDKTIGVVCLKGAGDKAFIAGADIKAMSQLTQAQAKSLAALGQSIGYALETMPQITVACVDGFALGGGCEMAMACDLIYASEKAKFGQPEVNLGVIAGFGGTQRLPRAIGIVKAKELLFTGKMIDAEEAKALGLVCEVFAADEFAAEVQKIVDQMLSKGPRALSLTKKAIDQGYALSIKDGCDLERDMFASCFETKEQQEGMDAFINKRKAEFHR